jgi:electron transport complex protein RnfB
MAGDDLYEELCKFYELMLGKIPRREEFKRAVQDSVSTEELSVFFLLPLTKPITLAKLRRKAQKANISEKELDTRLVRLASEGLILAYETPQGPACERGNPVFMTEQQVRKPEATPRRAFYAEFFSTFVDGDSADAVSTKTPYFRVLPVEATVTAVSQPGRTINVDEVIPDPRQVLPIDVISEMIRNNSRLIGVAECYCRKAKRILDQGCEHPLETCLVFNELADTLINYGTARRIDYEEAMQILWQCEELGLVHNVDNCQEEIRGLCNCCPSCCAVLNAWMRGQKNAGAPSRYAARHDADKCKRCEVCISRCPTGARAIRDGQMVVDADMCLGCGLCVTACPQHANQMVPRETQSKIPRTNTDLYDKIGREAIIGMIKTKILGR